MAEVRIKDIDEHEIDTILAEDIDFEGHLTFKKPLMIKGKFKGEIQSSSALYIGEKAFVEAATEASVVSSKGKHKGNIVGHARVELFSSAQVEGDITTPDFVVESGCRFNGYCNMGGATRKEAANHQAAGQGAPAAQPHPPHAQPAPTGQAGHPAGQPQAPTPQRPVAAHGPGQQGAAPPPQPQRPGGAPGQGGQPK